MAVDSTVNIMPVS